MVNNGQLMAFSTTGLRHFKWKYGELCKESNAGVWEQKASLSACPNTDLLLDDNLNPQSST